MKLKILTSEMPVRCSAWSKCGQTQCNHYDIHYPDKIQCRGLNQVSYCRVVCFLVSDVRIVDIDSAYENDPNLAFKAFNSSK